jgi:serine/threonine protein kinase
MIRRGNVNACRLALQHPGIIATYEAYETRVSVVLVQEYMGGGDLFDYMERSGMAAGPESQIKRWFAQLADAVTFMHDVAGVVHRCVPRRRLCGAVFSLCLFYENTMKIQFLPKANTSSSLFISFGMLIMARPVCCLFAGISSPRMSC